MISSTTPAAEAAKRYLVAGISVLPIKLNGTKSPKTYKRDNWKWQHLMVNPMPLEQVNGDFHLTGIGTICGAVSGGLEVIDIDDINVPGEFFAQVIDKLGEEFYDKLVIVRTPRDGRHILYRCSEIEGNQKLAMRPNCDDPTKASVRIETRGEGGFVVAPGSPPETHPTGKTYDLIQGDYASIPTITPEQRDTLFTIARSFDRSSEIEKPERIQVEPVDIKPVARIEGIELSAGDDFNQRVLWIDILIPLGWSIEREASDGIYWRRPGKDTPGHSAVERDTQRGNRSLVVFSTSAQPFEGGETYTKFRAYSLINHGGDDRAAAAALYDKGYGWKEEHSDVDLTLILENIRLERQRIFSSDNVTVTVPASEPDNIQVENSFELNRITAGELANGDYSLAYYIPNVLVAGQPAIVAGPKKALKTSICTDLVVSLASGKPFLGYFTVEKTCRVGFISGESGLNTLQETALRVCAAADIKLQDLSCSLIYSDTIPHIESKTHLKALERFCMNDELEVLVLDPTYLAMSGGDAGNLFAQGAILRGISRMCQDIGVTLILVHHTKKSVADPFAEPEMDDIAWAGFQEFAGQWIMLGRREKYTPGTGEHRLWLSTGARTGHGGLWGLDISEGVRDDEGGRYWDVQVGSASNAIDAKEARRAAAKEEKKQREHRRKLDDAKEKIFAAFRSLPDHAGTKSDIATAAGLRAGCDLLNEALGAMFRASEIEECDVHKQNRKTPYSGFRRVFNDES